ncbi:MAG TPA: tetratricopeptide repeat protein, partial [Polyangiaceae bacterium]
MPIDREKVLQAAQKHVEKKKYDAAIAEYQKIIQDDPNDARTLLKIGDLQARLQAYPEAIATYDRVGQHYAIQGFSLKAIAVYKQIREIIKKHAPELGDRYGHIGPRLAEIYTQLGLTSDALAAWDEVATRLQRGGRDREAVDVFRKMVELDASNPLPHLRLAEACCRVQALDDAIESFWTAADLLLNLGRQDDALKVIERILHFRADSRYARVAAELYLARGSREDGLLALAKLQICFQANPKDLDTLGLLGQAFTCIGQDDKAIEVYKEMARVARDQGRVDVFDGLLEHLRNVAPDDDQVRALAQTSGPPPQAAEDIAVEDGDVEFLDDPSGTAEITEEDAIPLLGRVGPSGAPEVVIVDDHLQAAEEVSEQEGFDRSAHAKKAVADSESFRKLRLFPKAIETLHIALEIDPRSLEIRAKLRDILLEAGDRESAIAETVNLALLYIDAGEFANAEPLLVEVLEQVPSHEGARALYEQIAPGRLPYLEEEQSVAQKHYDGANTSAPLPSYDLEEVSAEQALSVRIPGRSPIPEDLSVAVTDEPFQLEEPLPSFPLQDGTDTGRLLPVFEEIDEVSEIGELSVRGHTGNAHPPPRAPSYSEMLEEVLEEAEFFVARGLFDDARAILHEQLTRTPNHRLVLERLHEVEQQLAARAGSRTVDRGRLANPSSSLDVSGSLDALDRIELPAESLGARPLGQGTDETVDADKVFANFKAGIRAQVTEGDSATHFDLGIAYKEMGLVADAIHELELASRDPTRECMCFATIGMIHLEQNQHDRAADAYLRALSASIRST